jgi:holo-[acyl-carrier protein] synthase
MDDKSVSVVPRQCLTSGFILSGQLAVVHGIVEYASVRGPMIVGIGIDIVVVDDLRSQIEQISDFLAEIFSDQEINECRGRPDPYQCFAARFAAKEAFMKAAGSGWTDSVDFQQLVIVSDGSSVPTIDIGPKAREALRHLEPFEVRLSMTHTPAYSCAVVVLER